MIKKKINAPKTFSPHQKELYPLNALLAKELTYSKYDTMVVAGRSFKPVSSLLETNDLGVYLFYKHISRCVNRQEDPTQTQP